MNNVGIKEYPFLSRYECAQVLEKIFEIKPLWENRKERRIPYRNADWFTIGTPLYLDLLSVEKYGDYVDKVGYFNEVLSSIFGARFFEIFRERLAKQVLPGIQDVKVVFLAEEMRNVSLPGFHIFGAHRTGAFFFGKKHRDMQWDALSQFPNWPWRKGGEKAGDEIINHFSVTLPLRLPFLGGGLLFGDKLQHEYSYREGHLYLHSGQFDHAIAPYNTPILPGDYRITLQCHGFFTKDTVYLYW